MLLHLLRMRRNVNWNVFNGRENVTATTSRTHTHAEVGVGDNDGEIRGDGQQSDDSADEIG